MSCKRCGPGYESPQEAIKGPRETVLFLTAPHALGGHDALFSVDVDPESGTYQKIIGRVDFPNQSDEVHHTGWNSCSSCYSNPSEKRTHLILPCLNSDRVYIVDVRDPKNLSLSRTVESDSLHKEGVSFPHTSHCLADGNIMISTLGDEHGNHQGNFLLLDGKTFEVVGKWLQVPVEFNYDFWYQPRRDVMISTEWGAPRFIKGGFHPAHVTDGRYGNSVHVFKWTARQKAQTIQLPLPQGALPLEVRFLHEPTSSVAFVGCALGSSIFMLDQKDDVYQATLAVEIPGKKATGWALPIVPALITDILVSMDDRFLFVSCWLHGDIRQYDISDPASVRLVGQVYIGGCIHSESEVELVDEEPHAPLYLKGKRIEGGPQMLQLSLDGKRLYVTTSLYAKWDAQFYPKLSKEGAVMLQVDVSPSGGLSINEEFLVDFGGIPGGPYLAHEMRYPGGDCTSDIWI